MADKNAQFDDDRNPYYKQAQQDLDSNDTASAVADYEAALGVNPKLAGAHYQLGMIYSNKLNDPVSAIYHLRRFLDLSPNADQASAVKDLVEKESYAFASSLPNSGPQNAQAYADLQNQVATLKKQLQDATGQTVASTSSPTLAADPAPAAAPATNGVTPATGTAVPPRALPVDPSELTSTNAPPPGARSYKVVKGDSLWRIAHKMYPHDTKNGVAKIEQANAQVAADGGKHLKPGQVLVIP